MSKKSKKGLLPKLRFPEFRDNGEWDYSELGAIFTNRQESGFISLPLMSLTEQDGIILQEDTNRKNNSNSDKSKYLRICVGDIAYNTMRMWQGRCAYVNVEGIVSPAYTICRPNNGINGLFFYFYFKTSLLIKKFRTNSQGLVNDTLSLKYDAFSRISILYPSFHEQQKIADCLSSLDDLIIVEGQKLDALKTHKKGLMQQLFPTEGETIPKLRFKGFKDNLKLIGFAELGEIKIGLTHTPKYIKTGVKFLSSKNISNGYIDFENVQYISEDEFLNMPESTKPKKGDILFTRVGSNLGNPIILEENITFGIFVSLGIFRVNQKAQRSFVKYWMDSDCFWKQIEQKVAGGAKNNLNTNWLKEFELYIPSIQEQQKIADCLSSLDKLISAQTKKIETLRNHKKSLMQQLFPSVEEVNE